LLRRHKTERGREREREREMRDEREMMCRFGEIV
jgi:hypothetical protein